MMITSLEELIKDITYKKQELDRFFNPAVDNWAVFDKELGYKLKTCILKDGIDGCSTVASYDQTGERRLINYRGKHCRINTYGNSFTQGHQVSDGETWQEYLAAHFGEPIRNFGVGGYGVYQAYLRMLSQEISTGSPYVILNIWSDDHYRSIDSWRWIRIEDFRTDFRKNNPNMFHANPWSYIRLDEKTKNFKEIRNPYPDPEELYKLCDEVYVWENFKDDLIVQLELAKKGLQFNINVLKEACDLLGMKYDFSSKEKSLETANNLHTEYALKASMYVVKKATDFALSENKKLLIILSYSAQDVYRSCCGFERFDGKFIKFLKNNNIAYIDTLNKHIEDFSKFRLNPEQYTERYYINGVGHYNPSGNHFFAFSIKEELINWLTPKPFTYSNTGDSLTETAGYLA
jgi:hypothetical protein